VGIKNTHTVTREYLFTIFIFDPLGFYLRISASTDFFDIPKYNVVNNERKKLFFFILVLKKVHFLFF